MYNKGTKTPHYGLVISGAFIRVEYTIYRKNQTYKVKRKSTNNKRLSSESRETCEFLLMPLVIPPSQSLQAINDYYLLLKNKGVACVSYKMISYRNTYYILQVLFSGISGLLS